MVKFTSLTRNVLITTHVFDYGTIFIQNLSNKQLLELNYSPEYFVIGLDFQNILF